jgi:predicted nucleic-acid-binding Zn-ribbon protein
MQTGCPKCGCNEIEDGKIKGYGGQMLLQKKGKVLSSASEITAKVCTGCGYITGLFADSPEIFKKG